jgi:hypothetical protein
MQKIIVFTTLIDCMCSAYATQTTVVKETRAMRTTEQVKPARSVGVPYGTI